MGKNLKKNCLRSEENILNEKIVHLLSISLQDSNDMQNYEIQISYIININQYYTWINCDN